MAQPTRRGRRVIGAVGLIAALAIAVLAVVVPAWTHHAPPDPSRPPDAFALTVLHVYDGDTFHAQARTPNDLVTSSSPIRVRLIGVDTPELGREGGRPAECWADEARQHLAELLPEGATVWAAPDRETWDDYGRRLFNLWTDDGRFVGGELVAAGDAETMRIRPNVAYHDVLTTMQAEARAAGRGRWGACP